MTKKKPAKAKTTIVKKPPMPVSVMSDELDKLKECETLVKRIERCEEIVAARRVAVEETREELKHRKGSLCSAQIELEELCRARKEKHPLFDGQREKAPAMVAEPAKVGLPAPNAAAPPAGDLAKIHIVTKKNKAKLAKGLANLVVVEVLPGGIAVAGPDPEKPILLADGEFDIKAGPEFFQAARKWRLEHPVAQPLGTLPADGWTRLSLVEAGIVGQAAKLLEEKGYSTLGKLIELMRKYNEYWFDRIPGVGPETAQKVADTIAAFRVKNPQFAM